MHRVRFWVLIIFFTSFGCAHAQTFEKKEEVYAPVEASLCHINQKVASHFLISGVPDGFNEAQYKGTVKEICNSNPVCLSQAQEIFDSYGVSARKIDDMFSLMLCDKEMKWKVMEDFSCNNRTLTTLNKPVSASKRLAVFSCRCSTRQPVFNALCHSSINHLFS